MSDLDKIKKSEDKVFLKKILTREEDEIQNNVNKINSMRSQKEQLINQVNSIDKQLPQLKQKVTNEKQKTERFLANTSDKFTAQKQVNRSNELISGNVNQYNSLVEQRASKVETIKNLETEEKRELKKYNENKSTFNTARRRLNSLYKFDAILAQREAQKAPSLSAVKIKKFDDGQYRRTEETYTSSSKIVTKKYEYEKVEQAQTSTEFNPNANFSGIDGNQYFIPAPITQTKTKAKVGGVMTAPQEPTTYEGKFWKQFQTNIDNVNFKIQEERKKTLQGDTLAPVKTLGYEALGFVLGVSQRAAQITRHPIETGKQFVTSTIELVKTPFSQEKRSEFAKGAGELGQKIQSGQVRGSQIGGVATDLFVFHKATQGVLKVPEIAKNTYIRAGSTYVKPETIFDPKVVAGAETLPKSSSISQSISEFRQSNVVVTSSPSKIKGNTAGLGRKGELGLEDPGIYVTPQGRGSPYFLRVSDKQITDVQYSLNPLKAVNTKIPTVTRFEVTTTELQPRAVVNQPGFSATREFFENQAGSGKAFITKRSEIGQGNIKGQTFVAEQDFTAPFKMTIERNGQKVKTSEIKAGDRLKEAGTSELEAVVPAGSAFEYAPKSFSGRVKGFDYYTTFEGKPVAIRDAKLLQGENLSSSTLKQSKTTTSQAISGEKIAVESESLSSALKRTKIETPYPKAASVASSNTFKSNSFSQVSSPKSSQSNINPLSSSSSGLSKNSSPFSSESTISDINVQESSTSKTSTYESSFLGRSSSNFSSPSANSGFSFGGSSSGISEPTFDVPPSPTSPPPRSNKNNDFKNPFFDEPSLKRKRLGKYAGSLTGLVLGLETKSDKKNLTGLEIRPLKFKRGF